MDPSKRSEGKASLNDIIRFGEEDGFRILLQKVAECLREKFGIEYGRVELILVEGRIKDIIIHRRIRIEEENSEI